jgi:hypothetical protein
METSHGIHLVAFCGLYCGNCRKFKKGTCPGCAKNEKAQWCKIRSCCIENGYATCADCKTSSVKECKMHNNFISKAFSFVFGSDRPTAVLFIKEFGSEKYVEKMLESGQMVFKKK